MARNGSRTGGEGLELLAYCGLYCGLCAERSRIPHRARLLQDALHEEGWNSWCGSVASMRETFPVFWEFLDGLVKNDCTCRRGGGPPECKIRLCSKERGVEACPLCDDYPCGHIERLAEHYVTAIQDGKRLRRIGLEAWLKEQEERARRGFVYADIRVPWDE